MRTRFKLRHTATINPKEFVCYSTPLDGDVLVYAQANTCIDGKSVLGLVAILNASVPLAVEFEDSGTEQCNDFKKYLRQYE